MSSQTDNVHVLRDAHRNQSTGSPTLSQHPIQPHRTTHISTMSQNTKSPTYYGTIMSVQNQQPSQLSLHPILDPVEPPSTIDPSTGTSQLPTPLSATSRFFRSKKDGRAIFLRGVNLSGAAKQPFLPNIPSHSPHGFFEDTQISFVGRPFPLSEADEHFSRLRLWGFNFLRFNFTWEAIEHAGPGVYDDEFCDYVVAILHKAKEYGFRVFMDPHQDVWSRFTGGSGAPGWTLAFAGLNPKKFAAANAALVHNTYPEPSQFPKMIWATNYFKLAAATMFTLFFGGKTFAPKCFVLDPSQNNEPVQIQDFLQGHYIKAVQYLAKKIHDAGGLEDSVVIGYDTLNEPSPGWIGCHDITTLWKEQELRKGLTPTPLETMILGSGQAVEQVQVWEVGGYGPQKIGTAPVDPKGESVWVHPSPLFPGTDLGCIWANHGVWDPKTCKALIPHYFSIHPETQSPIEFLTDFWKPFIRNYTTAIRSIHNSAIIFLEPPVLALAPRMLPEEGDPEGPFCYAPHWYDGLTLISKHWNNWYNVDYLSFLRGKYTSVAFAIKFGEMGIKQAFKNQLKLLRLEGEAAFGSCPTLIGEIGIPFDMDDKAAYLNGDYSSQLKAMDANMTALEQNLLNFTIWNYCPDNSNVWGDNWNGEDLSIWCPPPHHHAMSDPAPSSPQSHPGSPKTQEVHASNVTLGSNRSVMSGQVSSAVTSKKVYPDDIPTAELKAKKSSREKSFPDIFYYRGRNLNEGARALEAFVRPFPILTPGSPLSIQFDMKKKMFTFTFEHPIIETGSSTGTRESSCTGVWDLDACGVNDPHVEIFLPILHFPKARNTLIWVSDGHVGLYLDAQRLIWRCGCDVKNRKTHDHAERSRPEEVEDAQAHEVVTVPDLSQLVDTPLQDNNLIDEITCDDRSPDGNGRQFGTLPLKSHSHNPPPENRLHSRQQSFPEVQRSNAPVAVVPVISEKIQSAGSVARHTIVVRYVHPTGREPSTMTSRATKNSGSTRTIGNEDGIDSDAQIEEDHDDCDVNEKSPFQVGSRLKHEWNQWITPVDSRRVRASDDDDSDVFAMCPQCSIM